MSEGLRNLPFHDEENFLWMSPAAALSMSRNQNCFFWQNKDKSRWLILSLLDLQYTRLTLRQTGESGRTMVFGVCHGTLVILCIWIKLKLVTDINYFNVQMSSLLICWRMAAVHNWRTLFTKLYIERILNERPFLYYVYEMIAIFSFSKPSHSVII